MHAVQAMDPFSSCSLTVCLTEPDSFGCGVTKKRLRVLARAVISTSPSCLLIFASSLSSLVLALVNSVSLRSTSSRFRPILRKHVVGSSYRPNPFRRGLASWTMRCSLDVDRYEKDRRRTPVHVYVDQTSARLKFVTKHQPYDNAVLHPHYSAGVGHAGPRSGRDTSMSVFELHC